MTSSALNRSRPPLAGVAVATALAAGALAPLAVFDLKYAAGAVGVLAFILLVMTSVGLGLAAWVVAAMCTPTPSLVTNVGLIVIGAAWFGSMAARPTRLKHLLPGQQRLVALLSLFVVWLILTLLWAQDSDAAWQQLRWWIVAGVVAIVVITSVTRPEHVRLIMLAFVVGAVAEIALGRGLYVEGRLAGTVGNANDLGNEMVPAIVFGIALIADRRDLRERLLLGAMVLIILPYFMATESRGALVGLVVAVPLAVILFRPRPRTLLLTAAVVVVGLTLALGVFTPVRNRLSDFHDDGSGRVTLWTVAWRIAETHQPEGIGLNNFQVVARHHVQEPGSLSAVEQIVERPHVVHNSYLGLLVETGAIGLLLYLSVLGAFLAAAFRASRNFERGGRGDMAWLARAVVIAGVAELCSFFFTSNANDFRLWVILALGPALALQSEKSGSNGVQP